jgi:glucan phosphorylase
MARALLVLLLLSAPTARAETTAPNVAYFSLEMASPALRGQRTGGLGVLAMDLVRGMARELVPRGGEVVGVTLLYRTATSPSTT